MRARNRIVHRIATATITLTMLTAGGARATEKAAIRNVIPLRFVQALDCHPGLLCRDHASADMIKESIRRANLVYADAGIKFWLKSNERHYMPEFHSKNDDNYTWSEVRHRLRKVFPAMPLNAYHTSQDVKTSSEWRQATTALYGDPDEVLIWVMDESAKHSSTGDFPHKGRALNIVAPRLWKDYGSDGGVQASSHLAHELGHFFGLRHPQDANGMVDPETGHKWTYAEQWDQLYCETGSEPIFYVSALHYEHIGCPGTLRRLYRDADYCGAGTDPFGQIYCEIGPTTYWAGSGAMKGTAVLSGHENNPPESSAWSFNVMAWRGDPNVDLRVPAFIPESQIHMVRQYVSYDIDFTQEVVDIILRTDGGMPAGATADGLTSRRTELGTAEEDFIWWANGDFTFASETRPISGTAYDPVSGDFDGDGFDDILWYYGPHAKGHLWWSDGDRTFTSQNHVSFVRNAQVFTGDFDGNGADDIYMYRPGSGSDYIWWSNGNRTFTITSRSVSGHYVPVVGDFDNDNGDDIAWYYPAGGYAHFWWSDGDKTFTSQNWVPVGDGQAYTPIAGDFDGAEGDDIVWYRPGSGQDRIWLSTSTTYFDKDDVENVIGTYLPVAGDFDGDGRDDIYWDSVNHTMDYIWAGTGDQLDPFTTGLKASVYGDFKPVAGTFDNNDRTDIFWYRNN